MSGGWGGIMVGMVVLWFWVWPESFGRHIATIVKAYRQALNEEG